MKQETALAAPAQQNLPTILVRQATDIAHVCKEIVLKTAIEIDTRKYVRVEGWTSIAVAHGCIATIKTVDRVDGGFRAVAEIHRQEDGAVLSSAEGFVGEDEPLWFGGPDKVWDKIAREMKDVIRPRRKDYAIRAMAQTRAVSRVCRTAFSHVVVLMDAGLETVPFEELNEDENDWKPGAERKEPPAAQQEEKKKDKAADPKPADKPPVSVPRDGDVELRKKFADGSWRKLRIHFGQKGPRPDKPEGDALGELTEKNLHWWCHDWQGPKLFKGKYDDNDLILKAALEEAKLEVFPDKK